jgi:anaerobic magnesium-protoporphyrin IX monomethyl ester cyclase
MSTALASESRLAGLRIALVFPHFVSDELASYADNGRFMGTVQPLSLLYVAAVLRDAGARVMVVDCPAEDLDMQAALARVQSFRPDYMGFTLTTVDWSSTLRWMMYMRERVEAPILVGGIHMECYPRETLSHTCIDLGYAGQADGPLVDLLEAHQEGRSLAQIPGAVFREDSGEVQVVPMAKAPKTDAGMPLPARELVDNRRYFSIVSQNQNYTAAMSNFGCPYGCEFCILRASPVRQRSAVSIVDEMERSYYDHGIREMDFYDPVFTLKRKRVFELCDELDRRNLKGMIWSIRARTDAMDEGILDRMWQSGCRRIFYGIESGSPEVRRRIAKRLSTNEDILEVLHQTKKRGYEVLGFVMIGNPLETRQTVTQTRDLIRQSPIDLLQVASLFPLPGTPIYKEIVAQTGRDSWAEHVLHGSPIHPVTRLDTSLSDEEVRSLVSETYAGFYLRPGFALYALKRTRDPVQLRRGLAAARGISQTFVRGLVRGSPRNQVVAAPAGSLISAALR